MILNAQDQPVAFRGAGLMALFLLAMAGLPGQSRALEPDRVPRPSVDDIARQISLQPQWRILSAEPMVEDQKTMYRFKVLNKSRGRVEVIVIDPAQPELEQFNQKTTQTN